MSLSHQVVSPFDGPNPFGEPLLRAHLDDIERKYDFWNQTPQLQYIAWVAAQKNVSAWGLLAACLVNAASRLPVSVVLVQSDGTKGDTLTSGTAMSLFVGLEAKPGGGKSKILKLAREIVPPVRRPIPDGTGQGLVKTIAETVKITKDGDGKALAEPIYATKYLNPIVVVYGSEIGTLSAEFAREGTARLELVPVNDANTPSP